MAGIFSLRNWVMKQLMKTDKSGIMKIPPKGKVDFGEMLLREQLFKKGIEPGMIKNEKQLDNILDTPAVPKSERVKPKKSGKVIEVDFDKGRWNKAQGGRAGLSYLLAEDTNERMPLAGGGSGKPPINFYVDFSGSGGGKQENYLGVPGLNESGYNYGGKFGADTTLPFLGGELSVGGELGIGRNKSNVDYKGQPIDFLSNVGETKLGDDWNVGMKWRKKFAGGGMGRRAFLKLMAALGATGVAAKSGLVSLLGKGGKKQVAKELTQVPIKNIKGMPAWFKPLVNKVIKEGDDVTKKFATKEREIVHQVSLEGKIGKDAIGMDDIRVTQSLDDGTIRVQYNTVDSPGEYGVDLIYKKGEEIPTKKGSVKTKDEFSAAEAEPQYTGGPEDADIEWSGENLVNNVDDLLTDTTKLETYATGKKPNIKKLLKSEQKQKKTKQLNESNAEQANYIEEKYGPGPDPSDYASGGIARMLGE